MSGAVNERPLVSVIMPAYNSAGSLERSVGSVKAQTVSDWELLIVDDCSSDGTYDAALALSREDARVRVFSTERNSGPAAARNIALENACGRYAAFLDSDDEWLPEKLERQIAFMREKSAAFSCTAYDRVDEEGNVLNRVTPFEKADYDKVLFYANPVGNSIRKRNDFALWLAALKVTDHVYGMSECLARYTVRTSSVSSNKRDLIRYQWQLYRGVERLSLARTLWAFTGLVYIKLAHPTWRGERGKDT